MKDKPNQLPAAVVNHAIAQAKAQDPLRFVNYGDFLDESSNLSHDRIIVAQNVKRSEDRDDLFTVSFLVKAENAAEVFADENTEFDIYESAAAVVRDFVGASKDESYSRYPSLMPFVVPTSRGGKTRFEFHQGFELIFDVHENAQHEFVHVTPDNEQLVLARRTIEAGGETLDCDAVALRTFLGNNGLVLVRFHAHQRRQSEAVPDEALKPRRIQTDKSRYRITVVNDAFSMRDDLKTLSMLDGKDLVEPYPDGEKEEEAAEFIVGVDGRGKPILESCDPDKLSSYFKDTGKDHFLTNVSFKEDVLLNYYQRWPQFKVESGTLRAGDQWLLPFDRTPDRYLHVWLGDLGRVPISAQRHWRAYNVTPKGDVQPNRYARDFDGQFADPDYDPIYYLMRAQRELAKKFKERFGSDLFDKLDARDLHASETLRLPIVDEWKETDEQIASLAKTFVETLSKESLDKIVPAENAPKDPGTLRLLWAALESHGWSKDDAGIALAPLHQIQTLRSKSTSHRRGSGFDKLLQRFALPEDGGRELIAELVKRLTASFISISQRL